MPESCPQDNSQLGRRPEIRWIKVEVRFLALNSEVDFPVGEIWSQIQNLTFEKFKSIVLGAPEELDNFPGHFGKLYTSTLPVTNFMAIDDRTKKRRPKNSTTPLLALRLKSPSSYIVYIQGLLGFQ